jgi:acyl-CoA reductase-like NAD-dependent aldehyde dehydrogenase
MRDYTKINIDGRWVSPRGGTTANTINPATGNITNVTQFLIVEIIL